MFVADCHCDTIGYAVDGKCGIINKYNAVEDPHLQIYAMYCEIPGMEKDECREMLELYINEYYRLIGENTSIVHCGDFGKIAEARSGGRSAAMLSVEGCGCIDSLEKLNSLYLRGVRFAGLTWNQNNIIGCGADATGTSEDTGLTSYGREFVLECERLGIIIDISHSSDRTVDDVLANTSGAVFASHSNFREVCGHRRNLRREHSDEINKRHGIIGLNLYYEFVKAGVSIDEYTMNMLLPHIEYAIAHGYERSIGFGFDIDGVSGLYPKDLSLEKSIHTQYIDMFRQAGIGERLITDMSGASFLRFIGDCDCKRGVSGIRSNI